MEYIFLEKTESTQDCIKKLVEEGKHDTAVLAKEQVKGRGRNGRTWVSSFGGLWFSFDTEFAEDLITLKAGVAVLEVCTKLYDCKLSLKWPNDLILNNKKVAGILCEKIGNRVVVGIGINTNNKDNLIETSTSFIKETGKSIDNEVLMKEIITGFQDYRKDVIKEFRENMAFVGEKKYVSTINKEAKIMGISDDGHLTVETENNIMNVFSGEIL